ncbi:MAG: SURF1 family cytochrome oxidase biogenesis protein [Pseudomonadota bacterium]
MKRLPILATIVVIAAIAVMIRLGFWQLDRKVEKEGLLARYESALSQSAPVVWPRDAAQRAAARYRRSIFVCVQVTGRSAVAGRNTNDDAGWAHIANCKGQGGGRAEVVLGWGSEPASPRWTGGTVGGIFIQSGTYGARLVADPPQAGLAANARPDPHSLPNNHLLYAIQWFLFALSAGVIYVLALRWRWRDALPS